MTDKRAHLEAEIAEANELIGRFTFSSELGNPDSHRIVFEARDRLAAAESELAELTKHHHEEFPWKRTSAS